jgi:energy-coupling factor transporter transmembrane protein EcfT
VPLAADYPFLDILWTMIIFFAWVAWIWMLIVIFTDVFRRRDIGGWAKAGWIVLMIVLPFIGVLIYLIAEHDGMAQRQADAMQSAQQQTDEYIRSVATSGPADQIARGKELLDSGAITQAEFDSLKARALATT